MIFSDTEFYYAEPEQINDSSIILDNEEVKHLVQVMRHIVGDIVFVTDGIGNIFESKITVVAKSNAILDIKKKITQKNKFPNITFLIPILKSSDRFEFALEKCVELGITNFMVYNAEKSYKRGVKIQRWEKILIAAMKQSLQSYKPIIEFRKSLSLIDSLDTVNIIFDQKAEETIIDLNKIDEINKKINFIFGPEGGLTENEMKSVSNSKLVKLTDNRLRAETAIISAASILHAINSSPLNI